MSVSPELFASLIKWALIGGAGLILLLVAYANYTRFWRRPKVELEHRRIPVTHTIKVGGNIQVANVGADHGSIVFTGWHTRWVDWAEGDYLTIFIEGNRTTRYRIEKVGGRTADAWFWAECRFAPRGA